MKKPAKNVVLGLMVAAAFNASAAFAYTDQVMDPATSYDSAVKVRQVNYACQSKRQVKVTYGFDKKNLPTYAQAYLNGKTRFLPINLARSFNNDDLTVFGDAENFSLITDPLRFNNYQHLSISVQDANSEFLYKECHVKSVKRIKG